MQKWEYCRVGTYTMQVYSMKGEENSKHHDSGQKDEAMVIAELGLSGWEAFGIEQGFFYFKRPVED